MEGLAERDEEAAERDEEAAPEVEREPGAPLSSLRTGSEMINSVLFTPLANENKFIN